MAQEFKTLAVECEIKEAENGTGIIEGYGSFFGNTDSYNDVVKKGAFRRTLREAKAAGQMPLLLWQHDMREPIGAWDEMKEQDEGLYVKGRLFPDDIPRAKQAYKLLQEKAIRGLSIGYIVQEATTDGKTGQRTIKDADLLEVSIVSMPANAKAVVTNVKDALSCGHLPTEREFEKYLRDAGFSAWQAKAIIANGYRDVARDDQDDETKAAQAVETYFAAARAKLGLQ